MKSERLFHLVDAEVWRAFEASDSEELHSLEAEGFVHLSFGAQVEATLRTHFAGVERLVLLELHRDNVAADVKLEPARGGEPFPHLYRALRRSDVASARTIERGADGWTLSDYSAP